MITTQAFGELRELADQGRLQYPYSTRELVAVVRHLQVSTIVYLFGKCFDKGCTYHQQLQLVFFLWLKKNYFK